MEKRFGPVVAVQGLSLHAQPGELLAIVGPSGCGKTTLLRVMAGLEQVDAGRVVIGGRDATHLPPEKRNVGFVFQQFALFPTMNVAENIGYGLRRRRVPKSERERRVAELLAMIGMEGYDARRPGELSAGQQQRVALARALAPEPRTLLLDEPLSALDAAIRHQLRDELRRVQRRVGITTIMVTHDQEEALAIADRVAVMNEGRLEQVGTPWELYDQPRTHFVGRFVGRGNFLHGEFVRGETAEDELSGNEHRFDRVLLPGFGVWPLPEAQSLDEARIGLTAHRPDPSGRASRATGGAGGDRRVTVLVRPEVIRLSLSEVDVDSEQREHAFVVSAIVRDIVFGGERAHVQLQLVDSGHGPVDSVASQWHRLMADRHHVDELLHLTAAVSGGAVPSIAKEVGKTVTVIIPHDALRLLPD